VRLLRVLRGLLLSLVLLVVALPPALALLLASEPGSRWLLRQAPQWLQPLGVDLAVGKVEGRLLGSLQLSDVSVRAGGAIVAVDEFRLGWRPWALLVPRVAVEHLVAHGVRVDLPPASDADTEPASGPPSLPDVRLPLVLRVDRLAVTDLVVRQDGQALVTLDQVETTALADAEGIVLSDLVVAGEGARVEGYLALGGVAPHPVDGQLRLAADASLTGEDVGAVAARLRLAGAALQPSLTLAVEAPAQLTLSGSVDVAATPPRFDLQGRWPRLAWPPRGDAAVSAEAGRLVLAGTPDAYDLTLVSRVGAPQLPPVDVDLALSGDTAGAVIEQLVVTGLGGRSVVDGKVGWAGTPNWDLALRAEGIDPGVIDPGWPGRLDAAATVAGEWRAEVDAPLQLALDLARLEGRLRDYPVRAQGAARVAGDSVTVQQVEIVSDVNRVTVDGVFGARVDGSAIIDAPSLDTLLPGAAGELRGEARIGGTREAPTLVADLRGAGLSFGDARVASVVLDAAWRNERVDASLIAETIQTGGYDVERVQAELDGTVADHVLSLAALMPDARVDLVAGGGLDAGTWRGELRDLQLADTALGDWGLRQPVPVAAGSERATLGELCLSQQRQSVCAAGDWQATGAIDASLRLDELDLSQLAPLLPGDAVVEGRLDGRFDVGGSVAAPRVEATLVPGDGRLRLDTPEQPLELAYREARAELRFAEDRGKLSFGLQLNANGVAAGEVRLGAAGAAGRKLDGKVDVDFPDLSLVAGFVPALSEVEGRLGVDLTLAGTTQTPRVRGRVAIEQASARVVPAGIELQAIDLVLSGEGDDPLVVDGSLRSGDGSLSVSGTVDPAAAGGPAFDIRVSGERFQAARLPQARVWVSPDLRVRGAGDIQVSGEVVVPEAEIEVKSVPKGAVKVSSDEIVVGADTEPAGAGGGNVSGDVRLVLGDEVRFKGFGLVTRLVGTLKAVFGAKGTQLDGKIEMRDGRYKAYGQDLTIEQGRLLFAGPPERPDIDLRAARVSRDGQVTAYLAMSGPIGEPRPRIYTEPPLPESEALAYLVTGRGLGQAGEGESFDIVSAAFSLGVARGEPWLRDLSERVGLDDLRVEAGEDGIESSSLLLGKYLNPDLYVGYTQELFNPEGAVLVRLRLSEHVEVETRSGREQSVDLIYRLEHD
jgi:translocation and assembly module TamB